MGECDRRPCAEDLHELLRSLGIERAHLIGVSTGGSTAIDFAILYPRMVGALVPVAAGVSGPMAQLALAGQAERTSAPQIDPPAAGQLRQIGALLDAHPLLASTQEREHIAVEGAVDGEQGAIDAGFG